MECRYNEIQNNGVVIYTVLQRTEIHVELNQRLHSQTTRHTSPSWASYAVSFVKIRDKIDRIITAQQYTNIPHELSYVYVSTKRTHIYQNDLTGSVKNMPLHRSSETTPKSRVAYAPDISMSRKTSTARPLGRGMVVLREFKVWPSKFLCWVFLYCDISMMTSSNGNFFRVTGHLCGEFTGFRSIPRTKASNAELWCFLWSASE